MRVSKRSILSEMTEEEAKLAIRAKLFDTAADMQATAWHFDITRAVLWYWIRKLGMHAEPGEIRRETRSRFRLSRKTA